jgi:hypothetical protein
MGEATGSDLTSGRIGLLKLYHPGGPSEPVTDICQGRHTFDPDRRRFLTYLMLLSIPTIADGF